MVTSGSCRVLHFLSCAHFCSFLCCLFVSYLCSRNQCGPKLCAIAGKQYSQTGHVTSQFHFLLVYFLLKLSFFLLQCELIALLGCCTAFIQVSLYSHPRNSLHHSSAQDSFISGLSCFIPSDLCLHFDGALMPVAS